MIPLIRIFLAVEAAAFGAASLVHAGVLITGYEHSRARIAEGVIAVVLLLGLILTFIMPDPTRTIGLAAQGFALLGTLVGLVTVATGIGPRTLPDLVFHFGIAALLVWGLVLAGRG